MRHCRLALITLLFALALGACSRSPRDLSERQSEAIRDSVRATLDAYNAHYTAKNWDVVLQYYAEDDRFVWVEDGVIRYRSAAEIRQALESLPPSMHVETTYSDTKISVLSSDVASVVTGFETQFTDSTGTGFSFGGMITMTLIRDEGGWSIFGGHVSSPKRRGSWE